MIETKQQYLEEVYKILKKRFDCVKFNENRTNRKNQHEPFYQTKLKLYSLNRYKSGVYFQPRGFYEPNDGIAINVNQIYSTYDFIVTLLHEMVHAYVSRWNNFYNCGDHQGLFIEVGKQVGLKRPWTTQTILLDELKVDYPWIEEIINELGELPEENGEVLKYDELKEAIYTKRKTTRTLSQDV